MSANHEITMTELSIEEMEGVQGGIGVLDVSSAFGHLGRAFGAGYLVGEGINYAFEAVTGTSIGSAIYDLVNP